MRWNPLYADWTKITDTLQQLLTATAFGQSEPSSRGTPTWTRPLGPLERRPQFDTASGICALATCS
jgi:hypothetical protein